MTVQILRYHPLLVVMHWLLGTLIVAALVLGALVMTKIPNSDPTKIDALRGHMMGGSAIVILMIIRLFVRVRTARPAPASARHPALDRLAWASHRLLYVLVFAQAASGALMALHFDLPEIVFAGHGTLPADFWVYPVRAAHYAVSRLLMALIALHVAGALYHTFVLRDGLLRRIWFGKRTIAISK
jgi:cytochrome b561